MGTEDATIELYSLQKIISQPPRQQVDITKQLNGKSSSASFLKSYKTKANGVMLTQFTWRNFLFAVGCNEKNIFWYGSENDCGND